MQHGHGSFMPPHPVQVLAASGVAARRASEELMAKGVVTVNGQVVLTQVGGCGIMHP